MQIRCRCGFGFKQVMAKIGGNALEGPEGKVTEKGTEGRKEFNTHKHAHKISSANGLDPALAVTFALHHYNSSHALIQIGGTSLESQNVAYTVSKQEEVAGAGGKGRQVTQVSK